MPEAELSPVVNSAPMVPLWAVDTQFSCTKVHKPGDLSAAWTEEQRRLASHAHWPRDKQAFEIAVRRLHYTTLCSKLNP